MLGKIISASAKVKIKIKQKLNPTKIRKMTQAYKKKLREEFYTLP